MKTQPMNYQYESPAVYMTQSLSARESCWTVPSAKVWQLIDPLVSFALGWCTTVLSSAVSWALDPHCVCMNPAAFHEPSVAHCSDALTPSCNSVSGTECWHHVNARARSSKCKGLTHHYSSPTHHYSSPTHHYSSPAHHYSSPTHPTP